MSADSDAESFSEYFKEMPWAAVPFDAVERETLPATHRVSGIPRVVVLSGADGSVVHDDARALIMSKKNLNF